MTKFKKILIALLIIIVIAAAVAAFLFLYNKDTNKLKRYLTNQGYECNSTICFKKTDGRIYYMNYKSGYYKIEANSSTIYLEGDKASYSELNSTINCVYTFSKDSDNKWQAELRDTSIQECIYFTDGISKEYENYQDIFVKSKVKFDNLK